MVKMVNFMLCVIDYNLKEIFKAIWRDFPSGPLAKTLSSQCRGPRFDPTAGN